MKYQKLYNFITEAELSDIKVKKGKMHKLLGVPKDKSIEDVYTSGKKLAEDLVSKVGTKKAKGMLAFAANINSDDNIFDVALRNLPVNEQEESNVSALKDQIESLKYKMRNPPAGMIPDEKTLWSKQLSMLTKKLDLAKRDEALAKTADNLARTQERINKKKGIDAKENPEDEDSEEES